VKVNGVDHRMVNSLNASKCRLIWRVADFYGQSMLRFTTEPAVVSDGIFAVVVTHPQQGIS
jgi:hypothetical protein